METAKKELTFKEKKQEILNSLTVLWEKKMSTKYCEALETAIKLLGELEPDQPKGYKGRLFKVETSIEEEPVYVLAEDMKKAHDCFFEDAVISIKKLTADSLYIAPPLKLIDMR